MIDQPLVCLSSLVQFYHMPSPVILNPVSAPLTPSRKICTKKENLLICRIINTDCCCIALPRLSSQSITDMKDDRFLLVGELQCLWEISKSPPPTPPPHHTPGIEPQNGYPINSNGGRVEEIQQTNECTNWDGELVKQLKTRLCHFRSRWCWPASAHLKVIAHIFVYPNYDCVWSVGLWRTVWVQCNT